jgi:hypothetical protein
MARAGPSVSSVRPDRALGGSNEPQRRDVTAGTVEDEDLTAGLSIFTEAATLGAFDAVLAATSRRRGARALVSADRAFEEVRHLRHIDPGVPDLLAALEEG